MISAITTLTLTLALAALLAFGRAEFIAARVDGFDLLFGDVPRCDAEIAVTIRIDPRNPGRASR